MSEIKRSPTSVSSKKEIALMRPFQIPRQQFGVRRFFWSRFHSLAPCLQINSLSRAALKSYSALNHDVLSWRCCEASGRFLYEEQEAVRCEDCRGKSKFTPWTLIDPPVVKDVGQNAAYRKRLLFPSHQTGDRHTASRVT